MVFHLVLYPGFVIVFFLQLSLASFAAVRARDEEMDAPMPVGGVQGFGEMFGVGGEDELTFCLYVL